MKGSLGSVIILAILLVGGRASAQFNSLINPFGQTAIPHAGPHLGEELRQNQAAELKQEQERIRQQQEAAVWDKLQRFAAASGARIIDAETQKSNAYSAYIIAKFENEGFCWASGGADQVSEVSCNGAFRAAHPQGPDLERPVVPRLRKQKTVKRSKRRNGLEYPW